MPDVPEPSAVPIDPASPAPPASNSDGSPVLKGADEHAVARSTIRLRSSMIPATVARMPGRASIRKNKAAAELSKLGASKGGIARAKALTPKQRRQIAKRAAEARWARQAR